MEDYLAATLDSLLAQSLSPCEVLCVDDGSEDRTAQIARDYVIRHPRFVHLLQVDHGGAAAARNHGLEKARGEYIQFLDADDILLPGKLEHQMALACDQDFRADLVCGAFTWRDEATGREGKARSQFTDCWACLLVGRGAPGVTSSNLFRKERVIDCGGWDPARKSSQEPELMFRMMRDGARAVYDPEALTLKLNRSRGSIWAGNDQGPNRVAQTIGTLDLRMEILEYLVSHGQLTGLHLEAFSRGAGLTLSDLARLNSDTAERQQKRISQQVKEFAERAGLA